MGNNYLVSSVRLEFKKLRNGERKNVSLEEGQLVDSLVETSHALIHEIHAAVLSVD